MFACRSSSPPGRQLIQAPLICEAADSWPCPATCCSLGELEVLYRQLRAQCREEYLMYNLAAAALAQVGRRAPAGRGDAPRQRQAPACCGGARRVG